MERLINAIKSGVIDKETVKECQVFAQKHKNISTSQLRGFFGELRRIEGKKFENVKSEFYMLFPKLAYNTARQKNQNYSDFQNDMTRLMDTVSEEKHFITFMKVIEAIVAYHKVYETKS